MFLTISCTWSCYVKGVYSCNFYAYCQITLQRSCTKLHANQQLMSLSVSQYPCSQSGQQCMLPKFWICDYLKGTEDTVLSCFSLIVNEVEHTFLC